MSYNDTLDPTLLEQDDDATEIDHSVVTPDEGEDDIIKDVPVDPDEVAEPLDDDDDDLSDDTDM